MTEINVFGMTLPVIAELSESHVLAMHKNGPCIAADGQLWALELAVGEAPDEDVFDGIDNEGGDELPHEVRRQAIAKYVEWSMAKINGEKK